MPLAIHTRMAHETTLGLWRIEETPDELLPLCTPIDRTQSDRFVAASRRREWLAWRALLQSLCPGAQARYDDQGGPVLDNGLHIGVSHTSDYAAVILAPRPCAVDIEKIDRNYSRVLPRYASSSEQALGVTLSDPTLYPALFWCAKETLYKLRRLPGIDFLHDLHIDSVDLHEQSLDTHIRGSNQRLYYRIYDSLCCVYGLE